MEKCQIRRALVMEKCRICRALVMEKCRIRRALVMEKCRIRRALVMEKCRILRALVMEKCRILRALVMEKCRIRRALGTEKWLVLSIPRAYQVIAAGCHAIEFLWVADLPASAPCLGMINYCSSSTPPSAESYENVSDWRVECRRLSATLRMFHRELPFDARHKLDIKSMRCL